MKKSIRFIAAISALVAVLSLGLSGCTPIFKKNAPENSQGRVQVTGGQENLATDGTAFETVYVVDIFEFDRAISAVNQITSSPNGLYVRDEFAELLYEFDTEGNCLRELGNIQPDRIALDGSVWALDSFENKDDRSDRHIDYTVSRLDGGSWTTVLNFRTERGTADLTVGDGFFLITKQWWDDSNTGHYSMESYDRSGNLLHSQDLEEWFRIYDINSGVYFFGRDSYDIFLYDPQSYALNKVDTVDEDCCLNSIYDDMLYMNDDICLYRRPVGASGREALFRYDALYLTPGLTPIPLGDSGCFLFCDFRNDVSPYKIAYPVDKKSLPEQRQPVVMAINDASEEFFNKLYGSTFSEVIADFNTVNREYEVIVKNYYDCPDPQAALNIDIAAGEVPDLIDMEGFSDNMVTAGNATDLLPYFERDYGTDKLLQGPLQAMLSNGKLLSLIPSFGVTAILGPASLIDGQEVESYADLSAMAGGDEHVFYNSVEREAFLHYVFANNKRGYTAEQIADILAFAAVLPERVLQNPYDLPEEELEQLAAEGFSFGMDHRSVQAGEQKFELATVTGPVIGADNEGFTVGLAQEEGYFGERIAAIGLSGSTGGIFLEPVQELMMPLGAKNKDGAWEFMKFLLSDRYLVDITYGRGFCSGIPLTESAFERGMDAYGELDGALSGYVNGAEYSLTYDPVNCASLFQKLLNRADGVLWDEDELYSAVAELARFYFNGGRDLDQIAEDIASRIKLFHAEQG